MAVGYPHWIIECLISYSRHVPETAMFLCETLRDLRESFFEHRLILLAAI